MLRHGKFRTIVHADEFFERQLVHYRSVHLVQESDFEEARRRVVGGGKPFACASLAYAPRMISMF